MKERTGCKDQKYEAFAQMTSTVVSRKYALGHYGIRPGMISDQGHVDFRLEASEPVWLVRSGPDHFSADLPNLVLSALVLGVFHSQIELQNDSGRLPTVIISL